MITKMRLPFKRKKIPVVVKGNFASSKEHVNFIKDGIQQPMVLGCMWFSG